MSEVVRGNDGVNIPLADVPQAFTYDGNDNVTTITVVYRDKTYIQTFTYAGNNVTNITRWEVQP
jgi:hypothetical protein